MTCMGGIHAIFLLSTFYFLLSTSGFLIRVYVLHSKRYRAFKILSLLLFHQKNNYKFGNKLNNVRSHIIITPSSTVDIQNKKTKKYYTH